MAETPVSVIIPVGDDWDKFNECLDSVLDQTHTALEIIIFCKEGNSDTLAECRKIANVDKRITVVENKDASSLLTNVHGEYVMYLAECEHIYRHCIEELVKNSDADIVQCGYYLNCEGRTVIKSNDRNTGTFTADEAMGKMLDLNVLSGEDWFEKRTIFDGGFKGKLIKTALIRDEKTLLNIDDDIVISFVLLNLCKSATYIGNILGVYSRSNGANQLDELPEEYNKYNSDVIREYLTMRKFVAISNDKKEIKRFITKDSEFYLKHKSEIDSYTRSNAFAAKLFRLVSGSVRLRLFSKKERRAIEEFYKNDRSKKIFILSAPTHDNLGDQAILIAELELLKRIAPDYTAVALTEAEYYRHRRFIRKYMTDDDVIAFHGGGNIGDGYRHIEMLRCETVSYFKNKRFLIFPQTAFFSDGLLGKFMLRHSVRSYAKNKELCIFAREEASYKILIESFNSRVVLCPDVVMSLNMSEGQSERNGVLLCLRNDFEQSLAFDEIDAMRKALEREFGFVNTTDMQAYVPATDENRFSEFKRKTDTFKKYECVVTDRLHGMIFCAISGTPCVVLGNYNHKIKSSYSWLRHLPYIKFEDDISNVCDDIKSVSSKCGYKYDNAFADKYYDEIRRYIYKEI